MKMDETTQSVMVSSWQSWLNHARKYAETDPYATFLILYISFVIFCKDNHFSPDRRSNASSTDVDPKKFADNAEHQAAYRKLQSDSRYKTIVKKINEYFDENPNFQVIDYDTGQWVDARISEHGLRNHIWWIKAVRNNVMHGNKSMDMRSAEITAMACELLFAVFDEIIRHSQVRDGR